MMIRRAIQSDIPGINRLLRQVLMVHHSGRPDLFKANAKKYTDEQLAELLMEDTRPVFVAIGEAGDVLGYAFCILEQHIDHNVLTDIKTLYIDDLDVTTVTGADRAISALDDAIAMVSDARSKIGAYENRLEYATSSLDTFEENMTDAMSRLTDVDMAEEMTNYTQYNVLQQAGVSVLSQANDLPQNVLSLLQ